MSKDKPQINILVKKNFEGGWYVTISKYAPGIGTTFVLPSVKRLKDAREIAAALVVAYENSGYDVVVDLSGRH